jgi:hypothetical protein
MDARADLASGKATSDPDGRAILPEFGNSFFGSIIGHFIQPLGLCFAACFLPVQEFIPPFQNKGAFVCKLSKTFFHLPA